MRVGSVRGIDLKVDLSWLFIVALVGWNFWARFTQIDGRPDGVALVMAGVGAALFFGSILAHELAHALEAQRRGVEVHGITLFLFGGVTETRFDVRRPVDEFALTIVGPLTSAVIGGACWALSVVAAGAGWGDVASVLGLIGWLNLALAAFNMLPGAPLDGGRVLRAAVWRVTGDRDRAVQVAVQTGKAIGGGLIGLGVAQLLLIATPGIGGIWMALIGWFMLRAAAMEGAQHEARRLLEAVPARRLSAPLPQVATDTPVSEVVDRWLGAAGADAVLVVDHGVPAGVVLSRDVRAVPPSERSHRSASSVMHDLRDLPTVDAEAHGDVLLDRLAGAEAALTVDGDDVVGVVTVADVGRYLQRMESLQHAGGSVSRRR